MASDPTGARLRDFDVPVIMPRIAFIALPAPSEQPATTATCAAPAAAPVAAPLAASTGIAAPLVKLGLPKVGRRRSSVFRRSGLTFTVSSSKPVSDVEVRLVQLLPRGVKRPLGVQLVIAAGKKSATAHVLPTPFARGKLAFAARKRPVRAIAIVTAQDGSIGQAHVDFSLSR